MSKAKIAYVSSHFSGAVKLQYLLERGVNIASIITIGPQIALKYNISGYYDFRQIAQQCRISLYSAGNLSFTSREDLAYFAKEKFDILLISGWQRLIPEAILNELRIGAIGEHGSSEYLPRGRGRSPINWSILLNRRRFVLHIYMADAQADSGKIIDKEVFEINDLDDIYTVYTKAALASGRLFIKNYEAIYNNSWMPLPEAYVEATYYGMRTNEDDYIVWASSTRDIYNKIRATTKPYPGVKARIDQSNIITIWKAQPYDYSFDDYSMQIGEVLFVFTDLSFVVKTVDGTL